MRSTKHFIMICDSVQDKTMICDQGSPLAPVTLKEFVGKYLLLMQGCSQILYLTVRDRNLKCFVTRHSGYQSLRFICAGHRIVVQQVLDSNPNLGTGMSNLSIWIAKTNSGGTPNFFLFHARQSFLFFTRLKEIFSFLLQ